MLSLSEVTAHRVRHLTAPVFLSLAGIVVAMAATGCADRAAAGMLAKHGQEVATTGSTSLQGISDRLDEMAGERFIENGIRKTDPTDPTLQALEQQTLQTVVDTQAAIAARRTMLNDLGTLYASFGTLAEVDAKTTTSKAAGTVADSINAYAKQTKQAEPIDAAEKSLIEELAGAGAHFLQGQQIKKNSEAIRKLDHRVAEVLAKEQPAYAAYDFLASSVSAQLASDLFGAGIGRPTPILKRIVEANGLTYDEAAVNKLLDGAAPPPGVTVDIASVRDGVSRYVVGRAKLANIRREAVTQATIAALTDLEEQHKKLEAGKPVDLATVAAAIDRLRTLIELFNKAAD